MSGDVEAPRVTEGPGTDAHPSWNRRHRVILLVLVAQLPGLLVFQLLTGVAPLHAVAEILPSGLLALVATSPRLGHRFRSVAAAVGLMAASGVFVHAAGGATEAHFAYFVLLGVLALYDDWAPYAGAAAFVLVEHLVVGAVAPETLYGTEVAQGAPLRMAATHGAFVLAASTVAFVVWRWQAADRAASEARLRVSDDHLRLTFEAAPIGIALVDLDGRFLKVNAALCTLVGLTEAEMLATDFQAITHPDDVDADLSLLQQCLDGTLDGYEMQKRYFHADGQEVWVQLHVAVARDGQARPTHFVSQILDITERRAADAAVAASEARFAAMVEHGSDLIAVTDASGALVYASPAYLRVLGFEPASRIGVPLQENVHPDDQARVVATGVTLAATPGASGTLEFRYAHADGSWRWVEATLTNRLEDPAVNGFVINTRDVTERVRATERLAHQATHDALTGLPNRTLLDDRLSQASAAAQRRGELLAVVFVDVDHFKSVNDTHGHAVGDQLLTAVARRLQAAARAEDTVARLGGDEFVLIACLADEAAANVLAARVCASFDEPFLIAGAALAVSASAGVATTASAEGTPGLLEAADSALYEAKARGRATWVAYLPHMRPPGGAPPSLHLDPEPVPPEDGRQALSAEQAEVSGRYQEHVSRAHEALVIHKAGRIVAASPSAARLAETDDPARLIGRHVFDLVSQPSIEAARARQQAVGKDRWPHPAIFEIIGFGGRTLEVEVASTPTYWDGELATQLLLRPVEDSWAEIVRIGGELTRSVTQAVIITDLDFHVVAWNERATQVYGWTADEVFGRPLSEVVRWAGDSTDLAQARRDLETKGQWAGTTTQLHRDGTPVAIDAVTQLIHDRDGRAIGVVSTNEPSRRAEAQGEAEAILVRDLRVALDEGQLTLAYQPIVDGSARVAKVEALVRWQHPVRGLLMPCAFVPVVERSDLMGGLTGEVLRIACAQVADWRAGGLPDLELTVNVSARELTDATLLDRVTAALERSGLPPTALWLEVTETALAEVDTTGEVVSRLCALGVRFSLDDFGTGFATLAQLHRFPAHALKVDQLFVDGMTHPSGGDAAIVRSVLALGRELGLAVVAEGVETVEQRDALLHMGCELFQGYLFARPAFADPRPPWVPVPEAERPRAHRQRHPAAR